MARRFRVGISAALQASVSLHARTVLRAVAVAVDGVPGVSGFDLRFGDDGATGEGTRAVARRFVDEGVDAVVGPFSSDGLLASADIYAEAGIPLVLPGATVCLSRPYDNVFRVCPHDRSIAAQVVARVRERGFRRVGVSADDSAHCARLRRAIVEGLGTSIWAEGADPGSADAFVFTGRLRPSRAWLAALRASGSSAPVLMTDDAASPELVDGLDRVGDLEVIGFPLADQVAPRDAVVTRYRRTFGPPPIYALEVLAALAVLAKASRAARAAEALRTSSFETVFGTVRFREGERVAAALSLWSVGETGVLEPRRTLASG